MFNNANVIYRTKFVDGVSAVTRTVTQRGRAEQQKGRCRPCLLRNELIYDLHV